MQASNQTEQAQDYKDYEYDVENDVGGYKNKSSKDEYERGLSKERAEGETGAAGVGEEKEA